MQLFITLQLCSPLLINTGLYSLSHIFSANYCSQQAPYLCFSTPSRIPVAAITLANKSCLLWIILTSICNLRRTLYFSKNTHEQLHTRPDTHSVWSIVAFTVSPWKRPVQQRSHCSPLIHSFPLFWVSCWLWLSFPGQGQFPVGCRPAFVLSVALSSETQIFCKNSNFQSVWKSHPYRNGIKKDKQKTTNRYYCV